MSWGEIKKSINSDLDNPLNELIKNRPILINPLIDKDFGENERSYPYLSEVGETSSYAFVGANCVQKENCFYTCDNENKKLNYINAVNGKFLKILDPTTYNPTDIVIITKSYIYFSEWTGSKYVLSRYNINTKEYKSSPEGKFDHLMNMKAYISYEDEIYAYNFSSGDLQGYYKVIDEIDNGGSFSYEKISDNLPIEGESMASNFNSSIRSMIELHNKYIIVGWYAYFDGNLRLLRINTVDGESEVIKTISKGDSTSVKFNRYVLSPIKYNNNVVGCLFGTIYSSGITMYRITKQQNTEKPIFTALIFYLHTKYKKSENTKEEYAGYFDYENKEFSIFWMGSNAKLTRKVPLAFAHTKTLFFLPKGLKVYTYKEIKKIEPYLENRIYIQDNGLLNSKNGYVPKENYIATIEEDGLYDMEVSADDENFNYLLGTFF